MFPARKRSNQARKARSQRRFSIDQLELRQLLSAAGLELPNHALLPGHAAAQATPAMTTAAPAGPSLSATAVSSSQVNLSWNSVAGATGFHVYRWNGASWTQIANLGSNATNYAASGLSKSTLYYFDVVAYNSAGSTASAVKSATTLAGAPTAPTLTATAVSSSQVNLSWNMVAGANGYRVYQWTGSSWAQLATLGNTASSYAVTGLKANTTYWFDVAAYNSSGSVSSAVKSATTRTAITIVEPAAGATYSAAQGTLFGSTGSPRYTDVQQGNIGDCWLMSGLATVAAHNPSAITSMFSYAGTTTVNGSTVGLYNVRFYNQNGVARNFLVDTMLPGGGSYYAHTTTTGSLWVGLAEKAYVVANQAGWVRTQYVGSNAGYAALNGGWGDWSISAIVGHSVANNYSINTTTVTNAAAAGAYMVLGSSSHPADGHIVGDSTGTHAYALIGYNPSRANPFEIYNPWGNSAAAYNNKYGDFYCNAAFIYQNFAGDSYGYAAAMSSNIATWSVMIEAAKVDHSGDETDQITPPIVLSPATGDGGGSGAVAALVVGDQASTDPALQLDDIFAAYDNDGATSTTPIDAAVLGLSRLEYAAAIS